MPYEIDLSKFWCWGTMFFGLNTPQEEVLRTLAMIPVKGSIRKAARATCHDKNTIRWLDIAGAHSKEAKHSIMFNDLHTIPKNINVLCS